MSEQVNDGGPAFPDPSRGAVQSYGNQAPLELPGGMSLRDWFAGQALAGLWGGMVSDEDFADTTCEADAKTCYQMADAMLKARGGGK